MDQPMAQLNKSSRMNTSFPRVHVLLLALALIASLLMSCQMMTRADQEKLFKERLFMLRNVIDEFYADHGYYPDNLQAIVEERYLKEIPIDPLTGKADWKTIEAEDVRGGIWDVMSRAAGTALDGTPYAKW